MSDKKQEIIDVIKDKYTDDPNILITVNEELELMEITEGLNNRNNFDIFYEVWQRNKDKTGNKNAINSWTAYYLGITSKEPEGDFLPDRRCFARAGFPDIDTDFDDEKRDEVYSYLIDKYGRENVGNIGTHGLLKFKSCITRLVKVLDIANSYDKGQDDYVTDNVKMVNDILSPFPKQGVLKIRDNVGESHLIKTSRDAYRYCSDFKFYMDQYPEIMKHAQNIEGNFANFGCLARDTKILTTNGEVEIRYLNNYPKIKIGYIDKNKKINYTDNFKMFKTGVKLLYKLILEDKRYIKITDEHLVFTDKGCVSFEEIRKNIEEYKICCFHDYKSISKKYPKNKKVKNPIFFSNIKSVEKMEEQDVYDISILDDNIEFFEDEHNYIANRIVVHNSHAAGIVLSDVPLETLAPLRTARKGTYATQFPMEQLEMLGLIKFDILAISTLTVIKKTVEMIKKNYDIEIDVENMELNDKKTFKLYRSGNLAGVFQCEQWGMQQTMKEIGVDNFEDVMAAISLYRPGPMDSIPDYCSRKRGESKVNYFHPSIEKYVKKYLEKTYGLLVYQEQIMQVCNSLAGLSISDGYVVIKAIGKKKEYLMHKFKDQFIDGCVKNQVDRKLAESYWEQFIVPFASYGFNRCLDGSTQVKDKKTGDIYTIEELEKKFRDKENLNIVLDSCRKDTIFSDQYLIYNNSVEDKVVDVFKTGEQDVYEVELDNGVVLKCTKEHKFLCSDGKMYTMKDIFYYDLEIMCE